MTPQQMATSKKWIGARGLIELVKPQSAWRWWQRRFQTGCSLMIKASPMAGPLRLLPLSLDLLG